MSRPNLYFGNVRTPYGIFQIAATERGLRRVDFPSRKIPVTRNGTIPPPAAKIIQYGRAYLRAYFSRRFHLLRRIPVEWLFASPFDAKVMRALMSIRAGKMSTYSELAKQCGSPRAARAVGNALHRNPIPIVIPCHRVVRKDGSLGGYARGLRWKKLLLRLEGASL